MIFLGIICTIAELCKLQGLAKNGVQLSGNVEVEQLLELSQIEVTFEALV